MPGTWGALAVVAVMAAEATREQMAAAATTFMAGLCLLSSDRHFPAIWATLTLQPPTTSPQFACPWTMTMFRKHHWFLKQGIAHLMRSRSSGGRLVSMARLPDNIARRTTPKLYTSLWIVSNGLLVGTWNHMLVTHQLLLESELEIKILEFSGKKNYWRMHGLNYWKYLMLSMQDRHIHMSPKL